jgi:hypothetical protein
MQALSGDTAPHAFCAPMKGRFTFILLRKQKREDKFYENEIFGFSPSALRAYRVLRILRRG